MKLEEFDGEVYRAIKGEEKRLSENLELIASENLASKNVLAVTGSVFTNKYAEGYPRKRYYGGCKYVDIVEDLARERLKRLFNVEYANVQPHSGSQANMAVYFAFLKPGDKIMGMDISSGGHLTHGTDVSFSGALYQNFPYGVDKKTGFIDLNYVEDMAKKVKPKMIICGASSYPRIIDFDGFLKIANSVGAYLMADIAHIAGLIVAGVHPTPVKKAHFITGTTHKTLRGPRGGFILSDKKYGNAIDKNIFPGIQGGPLMNIIAAKAVAFKEASTPEFKDYQKQIVKNCKRLGEELQKEGFSLITGGTDNHLLLLDLTKNKITGKEGEKVLEKAGIFVNKNLIPYDEEPPEITSGLRIGTPLITTRGMKEEEMEIIAGFINKVLKNPGNETLIKRVKEEVKELCSHFPI